MSGIQTHLAELLIGFVNLGWSCTLLSLYSTMRAQQRSELTNAGVTCVSLAGHTRNRLTRALAVMKWLRCEHRRFDVVYTNANSVSAPLVWLAAAKQGLVMHHHHTSGDRDEQQTWPPLYSKVLRASPALIACSRSTAANIAEAAGRPAVFLPYLTAAIGEVKPAGMNDRPVCGYFGRLSEEKGISWFRRAAAELQDQCTFLLVGDGDLTESDASRNLIVRKPFSSVSEYRQLLAHVDFVALPSRHHEGMPVMLMEALSAGVPFVATDRGGVRELVEISDASIVTAVEYGEFKHALVEMIRRIDDGRIDRTRTSAAYEHHFGREKSFRQWIDFVESHSGPAESLPRTEFVAHTADKVHKS